MHTTGNAMKTVLRLTLAAACGLVLAAPQALAGSAPQGQGNPHGAVWDAWQPLAGGFIARRRVPARMELPAAERRSPATQEHAKPGRDIRPWEQLSLWFSTGAPGLYSVGVEALAAETGIGVGALRGAARSGRLSFQNVGAGVSWHYDAVGDRLLFAGETYRTFHAEGNAYQLRQTQTPDPYRMSERHSPKPPVIAGRETPFREVLHFEEETDMMFFLWLNPSDPDTRYWFWDYLNGSTRPQLQVPLAVPNPAASGPARLRVRLHGFTDLYPGNEHRVYAELNGSRVGSVLDWDGLTPAELVADFDQKLLRASGDNTLTLFSAYDASRPRPGQALESIEIEYLRAPKAESGRLWLRSVAKGAQTVTGFASPNIIVIESPVRAGVVRRDIQLTAQGTGWAVAFEAEAGRDYLVAETSAFLPPVVDAREQADLTASGNRADYLIIAPREFPDTAQALAALRQAGSGLVKVVWLDDIYKSFAYGRVDPFAIGRFMDLVRTRWAQAPTVVTLLGKGSLDRKDRMGYGDNFLPILMTANPWQLAPSDARLLGVGDGIAPFAYGRLPITSDSEGLGYVDKLRAHERQAGGEALLKAIVVADNPDQGGGFHADADRLAARLGGLGFAAGTKLYHPTHPVRVNLTQPKTWDSHLVTYSGHGTSRQLGTNRENFINADDASALSNTTYPVFAALTCSAGQDAFPGTRSLAGSLVLNPQGGAIASLAPTALSVNDDAHTLGAAFVDHLFGRDSTVGGALANATYETRGQIGEFMAPMFLVIGDPGVRAR